jgi:N-acetylmuramoyl-L-alanine amidase
MNNTPYNDLFDDEFDEFTRGDEEKYAWLDQPAPWHRESASSAEPTPADAQSTPLPEVEPNTPAGFRAPIEPEFEEEKPHFTPDMVGTQAWARQRMAAELVAEPAEFSLWGETLRGARFFVIVSVVAVLVATIFSYWTPDESLSPEFKAQMRVVRTTPGVIVFNPTALPTQEAVVRVGIIAGHSGPPQDASFEVDPGAVCDDNFDGIAELTELEINTEVARLVVSNLLERGYEVDLLNEFDPRLENYRGDALLSIHTNDCRNYGLGATGFNVAGPSARGSLRGIDEALVRCVIENYQRVTGLERHFGLTEDMTSYHTFREVSVDTPVAIIEIGFMFADRQFLTQQRPTIAQGITEGMLCFLDPDQFYNAETTVIQQ